MSRAKGSGELSRRDVVAGGAAGLAATGLAATGAWGAAPSPALEPYLSLREVGRRIAARQVSPVELTRAMLARIAKIDPVLKSYATVTGDQALADAEAARAE